MEDRGLPAIAMAAYDFRAMTSRRWRAGEAGGHLGSYVTSQPESEERGRVYTLDTNGGWLESGAVGRMDGLLLKVEKY